MVVSEDERTMTMFLTRVAYSERMPGWSQNGESTSMTREKPEADDPADGFNAESGPCGRRAAGNVSATLRPW